MASIVVDVKAQITGYQESLNKMKAELAKVDIGSDIGKRLARDIANAQKQLNALARTPMPKLSSESGIDSLTNKLSNVGEMLRNIGIDMQNITFNDLDVSALDNATKELRAQLAAVKEDLNQSMDLGLQEALKDAPNLRSIFKRMGQDLEGLTVEQGQNALAQYVEETRQKAEEAAEALKVLKEEQLALQNSISEQKADDSYLDRLNKSFNELSSQKLDFNQILDTNTIKDKVDLWLEQIDRLSNNTVTNEAKTELKNLITSYFDLTSLEQVEPNVDALRAYANNFIVAFKDVFKQLGGQGGNNTFKTIFGSAFNPDNLIKDFLKLDTTGIEEVKNVLRQTFQKFSTEEISDKDKKNFLSFINSDKIQQALDEAIKIISDKLSDAKQKLEQEEKALTQKDEEVKTAKKASISAKGQYTKATNRQNEFSDVIVKLREQLQEKQRIIEELQKQIEEKGQETLTGIKGTGASGVSHAEQELAAAAQSAQMYRTELEQVQAKEQLIGKIQGVVQRWFSIYAAVRMVGQAIRSVIATVQELDKTITEIAIVTNMSQDQLWGQMQSYTDMARQYATSISGVYKVSQLYYQQGLQQADVMALTEQTLKMARISGLEYATATDYMTNAVRSFKMEMQDAQTVVDVYSNIAASSATSTTELATAMSKTASSAAAVGSSFENTTAMMAVMIEATREAPENIGSAMKSIISRYGELKENPITMIDSEGEELSLNKVDTALKSVGITIQDTEHQFRDFDDVIMELAQKWDTIDKNTQRYIATVMAGNRQQSRFLALVSNGERLAELSEEAANSEDTATLQVLKTMDSIEAKSQQLKTSLQSLYTSSGVQNLFKGFLDVSSQIVKTFTQMPTIFNLPISAILKIGTTFASLANIVSTTLGLIKTKMNAQKVALTATDQAGTIERVANTQSEAIQKEMIMERLAAKWKALEQGKTKEEAEQARLRVKNAQEEAQQKQSPQKQGGITKKTAGVALGLNIAGVALSTISGAISDKTQSSKMLKGFIGIGGSIASMAGLGTMIGGGPWGTAIGAAAGAVMGVVENINFLWESAEARAQRLKEAADEANNNFLQKRAEVKSLSEQIEKLKELEKTQHDSAEARQEFIQASEQLAAAHPELIASLDSEGNAVLDLADTYGVLARMRREANDAAKEAALKSIENAENAQQDAENNREIAQEEQWRNFYNNIGTNIYDKQLREIFKEYKGIYPEAQFDDNFKIRLQTRSGAQNTLGFELANQYDDVLRSYSALTSSVEEINFELKKEVGSSNLTKDYQNILNELIDATTAQDTEQVKKDFKQYSSQIQQMLQIKDLPASIEGLLSSLAELNGGFLSIDADIANATNEVKANVRSSIAQLVAIPFMGSDDVNDAFYKEMEGANALLTQVMMNQGESLAAEGTIKKYSDFVGTDDFDSYLETISTALGQAWSLMTSSDKNKINDYIKNKGQYTASQLQTQIGEILSNYIDPNSDEYKAIINTYTQTYKLSDALKAIENRQTNQFKKFEKQLDKGGYLGSLRLGPEELQTYIDIYDKIASMWENDKISFKTATDAMQKYYGLWEVAKGSETAQALVAGFDDFSLTGLVDFRKSVENSILDPTVQQNLINAAETFVEALPVNFDTEFQTFSQKISTNMEDFEKAISNAAKGMDLKDATALAQKMGTNIGEFDFRNGKYFTTDIESIKKAYFSDIQTYLDDLDAEFNEEVNRLSSEIRVEKRAGADVTDLQNQLDNLKENNKAVHSQIDEYLNYQIDSFYIQNGLLEAFLKDVLGENATPEDIQKQLDLINAQEYDQLDENVKPFIAELNEAVNQLSKDIFDKAISSISGDGLQIVDATNATTAQKALLEALGGKDNGAGKYLLDLTLADIGKAQEQIKAAIGKSITEKQGREYLAELHNVKFEDNIYSALDDVIGNFENITYEAAQSLVKATGQSLEFGTNLDGTLKGTYYQMNKLLQDNMSAMSVEEYNALRAKLEEAVHKTDNEKVLADIIKNRDSLSEIQIANLGNMLNMGYADVINYLNIQDNGNGTASLSLQSIQTIIDNGKIKITDEIQQLIANEIDSIIASLNGLGDIQSKGTTKIADMQKQVAEINKLSGQNYTMQDLFTYSDTLHGFVYSSQGLVESARQMKEQLETLSGDERWAAEQILENTRNTFLQNIDVSSILNAERITPEIEDNFKRAISNFNKYMSAMGNASRIYGGVAFEALTKGGIEAVNAAQQIMAAQGKELSASDVEAAYRREVSSLVDAIDTVTSGAGALVDETTANLINVAGGKATELAGTGQYVVESAANLYDAYNELLNRLKDTGEATLADINKVAALALENKDGEQQAIDALGDAAGMTYTRFGEILAQAGYELSEELMSQLTSAGIVKQLGGSKMQIADFSAFADLMGWDAGSEEYVSAFKSYNDSLIEMNRKAEKNILEEAKNLENAKAGDQFNLTQLSAELNEAYQKNLSTSSSITGAYNPLQVLSDKLQQYGAELQDGILTIGADANLPAIIQEISNAAQQYGGLLSSEMAELADVLANVLKNYAELIQNGIKGTLSNVQADELKGLGKQLGVEVDFTKAKEGLKATQQSAIQLYNELKKIDALQGQMTLETLADSLEASNENYANVSTITARIAELQREIDNLQPGDARLQMYREELATAEDILRVRSSTDNKSFDFMNRDLPNGMQNPIDYWNSTGEAYKAMNQAAKSGYMEIQDFYNIVNEMNNMAAVSGQTLSFMGQTLSGKAEDAAALIEAGMGALKNVDGEGVKIALGSLGADFATGAADMTGDFDTGIKEMAKSQIKMLDAAIRMLEAIVAMENIDINGDGMFDAGEIFANGVDAKDGFTGVVSAWVDELDTAAGGIEIGGKSLKQALLELGTINPDAAVRLMNQLKNIDFELGDVNTFAQIQNVLSTFFPGTAIQQRGPSIFELLDIPSDANKKLDNYKEWVKKAGVAEKDAEQLLAHLEAGNKIKLKRKKNGKEIDNPQIEAIENLLGLSKKGNAREKFETFAGKDDGAISQEEIQLWSQLNIDYKKNGDIKSASYIASDGSECSLDTNDPGGWQTRIQEIEDNIFVQQQTGGIANSTGKGEGKGEILEIDLGTYSIKDVVTSEDGETFVYFDGKKYTLPDGSSPEKYLTELALQKDKDNRTGGKTTTVSETGELVTQGKWVLKREDEMTDIEAEATDKFKKDLETAFKSGNLQEWFDANKDKWIGKDGTLTLPGFEELNLQPGETPEQFIQSMAEEMFGTPDQFAEIPAKIAEGIIQAFQGDAGSKIGEAIRTGIENAFKGAEKESGTEQQAIPISEVTLAPEKVVLDLQGKTPTLKENPELNNAIPLGEINGTATTVILTTVGGVTKTEATIITNNDVGDIGDVTGTASAGEIISIEGEWSFVQTDAAGNITLSESLGTVKATADGATVTVADNNFLPETTDITTTLTYTSATGEVTTITVTPTSGYETDNTDGTLTYKGTKEVNVDNVNVKPTDYIITWTDSSGNVKSVEVSANVLLQSNNYTEFVNQIQDLVKPETKIIKIEYNTPDDSLTPEQILADPKYNWRPSYMNNNATVAQAPQINVATAEAKEATTEQVIAKGATIEANGASINTKTTGNENDDDSGISSITTSGAINVTGSPVNVAGISTGGNEGGGGTESPTLDISGITGALDSLQSALSAPTSAISLLTGAIQAIPTDKAQAVRKTAEAIDKLKSKEVTFTGKVRGVISASVDVSVSATGAPTATATVNRAIAETSTGAKGNVALAKGTNLSLATGKKQTLMGELGPELVVSNGRYYTVGNNGAEFVDLPEDAIVFNHKQTRKLLGNKGSIKGRGKPVKSENAAISFATGNVTGPAMGGGAAAALAVLKQIRSMWQSMLDASAKDLGSQAGAGRGGGGGGGGGGGDKNNARYIHDLEIWYNLLRQIAKLEKDISLEEAKQNKLQSDRIANGNKIYQSYKAELKYLDQSIAKNTQLVTLRKKYYEDATNKLKDSKNPFSKLFTFTSDGVLQYDTNLEDYINMITKSDNSNFKNGKLHLQGTSIVRDAEGKAIKYKKGKNKGKAKTTTFNKDIDIANSAMDFLALLNATNENGAAAYSPEEQVAILKAYGFGNVIQYDEKGQKITGDDAAIKMVENFWNQFDNIIKNTDDLFDDYLEGLHKIEELESQQNDVLDKIRDNQIDLENKVLDAIVEREQRRIDDAQDERDALEKANQKFLDGLNDSLQKERDLYQRNQDSRELNKLQRQLAILQRSGGSASQIRSLQDQINQKQRDSYFTAQEDQINAIQEASDLQIERLDAQIDIMTETLEYQKENGLLWGEVYQIMSGSAEQIVDFIQRYDKEFLSKGLTEQQKDTVDLLESAQIFDSDRGFENSKRQAWEEYLSKHTELQTEANAEKRVKIKQAFDENYNSTKNAQSAGNAAEIKRAQLFSSNSGNNSSNTQQSSGTVKSTPTPTQPTSVWSAELASAKVPYYSKVSSTKKAGNLTNKKNERVEIIKDNAGKNKKLGTMVQIKYNGKEYYVPQSKFKKSSYQKSMLNPKGVFTGIQFAKGGLVDFTGPAWVDGTPSKPEAFLNAEQTASFKKGLFNSELVTASIDNLRAGWDEFREQVVNNISNNSNETVVIEKAEVNMNVSQINDDYGAHRAGQEVMAEMLKIANKSGTRAITRR